MPIKTMQRETARQGRIRLGQTVEGTTKAGKHYTRPARLDTFRFTSGSQPLIEAVAVLLGGDPQPWPEQAGQWQVTTEASAVNVIIPPTEKAVDSWMEMWLPRMCVRRCDREIEQISGEPCMCPADDDERARLAQRGEACRPTTRLTVMIQDLPGLGTWMLESHGFYAAKELPGVAEVLASYAERRISVPARLRIEQRERKLYRGKDAEPELRKYPVPVLDVLASMRDLHTAVVEGRRFAGELPPPMVPVKAITSGAAGQVAGQRAIERQAATDAAGESHAQMLADDAIATRDQAALRAVWETARDAGVLDEFVRVPHYDELISLGDVIKDQKKAIETGVVA